MIETLPCLSCDGRGETYYICENRMLRCSSCDGTGKQERDAAWVGQGQRLRELRVGSDLSLREAAKRCGQNVVALSEAERGRRDPAQFLAALEGPPA